MIVLSVVLVGCTSVPIAQKFPDPPGKQSMIACPNLQKLAENPKLSDVSKTVTLNYTTYYECLVKNEAWIEWYTEQKRIFDNAAK